MHWLDLREKLDGRVLVADGAMGTLLAERGVGYGHPYDRANLSHPEIVRVVHDAASGEGRGRSG